MAHEQRRLLDEVHVEYVEIAETGDDSAERQHGAMFEDRFDIVALSQRGDICRTIEIIICHLERDEIIRQ